MYETGTVGVVGVVTTGVVGVGVGVGLITTGEEALASVVALMELD